MKRRTVYLTTALLCGIPAVPFGFGADDIRDRVARAVDVARQDVREATKALNTLRDHVATERKPLADELETLQNEVLKLRGEAERLRTVRYQDDIEREALQRNRYTPAGRIRLYHALLREYRRSFEMRQGVAESHVLSSQLKEIDQWIDAEDAPSHFITTTEALLHLAEDWNRREIGGAYHPGKCLDPEGTEHRGRFAVLGPISYFAAESGTAAGLVVSRIGSSMPSLFSDLPPRFSEAIAALVQSEEARVPFDVTGGYALKVTAQKGTLKEHFMAGGFVMIPLLLIGLAAILLTLWKVATLRNIRAPDPKLLDRVAERVHTHRIEEAQAVARDVTPPFDSVLLTAIEHRDLRNDHLEEMLHERALAAVPTLDRHLGLLAVLGGVAPLLGLLGTVTGMIHTFKLVTILGPATQNCFPEASPRPW